MEVTSNLLAAIMRHLRMDSLKQLITWSLSAKKNEIAELATLILLLWKQKDEIATSIIEESIADLCADCTYLVQKLQKSHIEVQVKRISIGLTGSLFSKDNQFTEAFKERLRFQLLQHGVSDVSVKILHNTALGSLKMLDKLKWDSKYQLHSSQSTKFLGDRPEVFKVVNNENGKYLAENILPVALGLSLTEKRNEKSMNLDRMDVEEAIDLMIFEEKNIFDKISEHKKSIRILVEKVCQSFQTGGRLFYVGAGTSGRLGKSFLKLQSNILVS